MKEKYLPIGTVLTLNGGTKRVMIIGYCPMAGENQVFDYSACTFPEGVITTDKTLAFNHDQIKEINFMGLEDAEYQEFDGKIKEMVQNVETLKNVKFPQGAPTGQPQNTQSAPQPSNVETLNVKKEPEVNSISDIMNS